MKPSELKKAILVCLRARRPLLIKGAPGIGKSDIVAQCAQETENDLIISHPVVSDPTDFKGLPFPNSDGTEANFLPFGDLNKLIKADKPTIFFLDDIGQAPASVQAACMQLLLARRINGHKVSDHVSFIAATNRREDRAGVQGLLEPVKSRFASIVQLEADATEWAKWAINNQMPIELIAFIRFRPALISEFKASPDLVNSPCPRTISNIGYLMNAGTPPELEFEMFSGAAGESFATEFLAFLKIYRKLPNPDLVLMDPGKAEIPTDPATLYALCGALSNRASEQNFGRLVEYANRLTIATFAEFSVMLISDCLNRHPELKTTKAFIDWSIKNADVLI